MSRSAFKVSSIAALTAAVLFGVGIAILSYMRRPELTPAVRGREVAVEHGCFACHGPGGTGGVPNPGSEEKEIPAWDGGNAMMYVKNEGEIAEWILRGHLKRLEKQSGHESHAHETESGEEAEEHSPPLSMPAFESVLSTEDLSDLIAYYKAVAAFETLAPSVREGYRVASRMGCFGCHGPGGLVGAKNPRSFKGYIPPWRGDDYAELVKNDDELRHWILEGGIDRLESNPVARFFTKRQTIRMPAYKEMINGAELASVVEYIHWLQEQLSFEKGPE